MTQSFFISGLAISFIYVIIKFIEMKFVTKKNIPLKLLFRDALIIYLSSVLGLFVRFFITGLKIDVKILN